VAIGVLVDLQRTEQRSSTVLAVGWLWIPELRYVLTSH
jgi:hypothetical protein